MYAVVDIAGQQYKVKKDQKIYVHRLKADEGSNVEFDKVLLVDNDGKIAVGNPFVDGTRVAAKVLSHAKGDKVLVFKKKRRKGYKKMNGHRQYVSYIQIKSILAKGETYKEEASAKTVEPKPKKVASKKEDSAPTAKAAAPKKKAAAKKTTKKKED